MNKIENFKFAIDKETKQIVHVDSVPNGKECGCICPNPSCNSPLQAVANYKKKKNEVFKVSSHFRHTNTDCEKSAESLVHRLGKQVISEDKAFYFKEQTLTVTPIRDMVNQIHTASSVTTFNKKVPLHQIQEEKSLGPIRTDLYAEIEFGKTRFPVNLEILVSHEVDEDKAQKLKKLKLTTLEIDLSHMVEQAGNKNLIDLIRLEVQ